MVAVTSGLPADVVAVWSQLDDPTASSDPATGPLSCDFGCALREIRTPNRQIRSLVTVRSCPGSGGVEPEWAIVSQVVAAELGVPANVVAVWCSPAIPRPKATLL